jgi:glutamine cyclotransferase
VLTGRGPGKVSLDTAPMNPGKYRFRARAFSGGNVLGSGSKELLLLSDIVPVNYTYRVVRDYPHDRGAFTQGLEYHNGFMYEGTGNIGKSSLRKVELNTGEILKFRALPSDIFGEGITRINNRIFQVSYQSQVGFVYDAESFELLQKIFYQNREGWGLTNNGSEIIMSEGSNILYFMDTTYFSQVRTVGVYDHQSEVNMLNELEFIEGKVYANRYLTDEIVIIDPNTGKVEGKIDMKGLLKPSLRNQSTDVLNGIAYDREGKRIFVTGKNWPRLFEVQFVRK